MFAADARAQADLTDQQQAWIAANPSIIVGNELDWPPFDFAEDGEPMGYSIDAVRLAADKAGLGIEFVNGFTWAELLAMFKRGEIDVLPAVFASDERREIYAFTHEYATNPSILVVAENDTETTEIEQLGGRTLAVIEGFATQQVLTKRYPEIGQLLVTGPKEGLQAVSLGKVDGFIGTRGVISYILRNSAIPNLRIAGQVDFKSTEQAQLHFAVIKDRSILRDILQIGLDRIKHDDWQVLQNRWLRLEAPKTSAVESGSSILWWALALVVGVLLLMVAGYLVLSRASSDEVNALQFGSPRFRLLVFLSLSGFVAIVVVVGWLALDKTKQKILADTRNNLETVLASTVERLDAWAQQHETYLGQLGKDPDLVTTTERLLSRAGEPFEARRYFDQQADALGHLGFFIIGTDGINVATELDDRLGQPNAVMRRYPEMMRRVLSGEVLFVPPVSVESADGADDKLMMYFAAPIQNHFGVVIAVALVRVDRGGEFSKLMQLSRVGETGETYAFNQDGRLLSSSRFDDHLHEMGLLPPGQLALDTIAIRDPGGNMVEGFRSSTPRSRQPLTRMAADAIRRADSGQGYSQGRDLYDAIASDIDGYRDYRGVPVFGAWLWQSELGFGITSEIDVAEALETYHLVRLAAAGVLGITLLLSIGGTIFTLSLGQRANRALVKARDETEQRTQFQLNSLNSVVMRWRPDGTVIYLNDFGLKLFGFPEDEIIGKHIVGTIVPETDSTGRDMAAMIREILEDPSKFENNENENVCKDGQRVWMLWRNLPVLDDAGDFNEVLTVGIDITDRKLAEERLRKNEHDLRQILENSPIGVAIVSKDDYQRRYMNPRFLELMGAQSEEELIGARQEDSYVNPDDYARLRAEFSKDEPIVAAEMYRKRLDGTPWWALMVRSLVNYNGEEAHLNWHIDLTDRKKTEEELATQSRILNDVLDNIAQGVVKYDSQRKLLMWNQQLQDILSIPDNLMNEGRPAFEIASFFARRGDYGEGDPTDLANRRLDQLWQGGSIRTEMNVGDSGVYDVLVQPTEDGGLVITYTDITLIRAAEREARESEQNQRQILETSPIGVVILSKPDGKRLYVNPRFLEMFGAALEDQLVGTQPEDSFVSPEDYERTKVAFLSDETIVTLEGQRKRLDGSLWWTLVSRTEASFQGKDVYLAWLIDITDRKDAERELEAAEANLRMAMDNMPGGIAVWGRDNELIVCNDKFVELLDIPKHLVVPGTPVSDVIRYSAERGSYGADETNELIKTRVAAFESREPGRVERRRPDGTVIEAEYGLSPEGYLVGVYSDITDQTRTAEELAAKSRILSDVLDNIAQGMAKYDSEKNLLIWNQNFQDFLRLPDQLMTVGRPLIELMSEVARHGDYGEGDPDTLAEKRLAVVWSGEATRTEIAISDENVYDVLSLPTDDGGLVSTYTDITLIKEAERAAQESEKNQRLLLETSPIGVAILLKPDNVSTAEQN